MKEERDFIRDKAMPFLIGLCANIVLSVFFAALYAVIIFSFAFSGMGGVYYPEGFSLLALVTMGVPAVMLLIFSGIALWLLNTWLFGKWLREKYYAYKAGREYKSRRSEYRFAAEREKERENFRQEAEWEAEWKAMKKQERESSLSAKPQRSARAESETESKIMNPGTINPAPQSPRGDAPMPEEKQ